MYELSFDVAVIGGGPAGLAAALSAREHGAKTVVILERDRELGGILQQCIHNGFGLHRFDEELTGPAYAERYIDLVKNTEGLSVYLDTMVLATTPERVIMAMNATHGLIKISSRAVVYAMGCRERTRGAIRIPGSRPAGVLTAGAAQRMVNMEGYIPGKRVVVLGSGDIGLIMARRMTLEGAKVEAVLEIMPFSNGLTRNVVQCLEDYDIPLYLSHTVTEIQGQDRITGITYATVDEHLRPIPGTEKYLDCDCLLLSVGLIPENELSREIGVEMDNLTGGPSVNQWRETNKPGFFAAGNVVHVHDLVDFVSEEGEIAGRGAARFALGLSAETMSGLGIRAAGGVRTVVPQRIDVPFPANETLRLYLRVKETLRSPLLQVMSGSRLLFEKRFPIAKPSEMIVLEVPGALLSGLRDNLIVSTKEKGSEQNGEKGA